MTVQYYMYLVLCHSDISTHTFTYTHTVYTGHRYIELMVY